MVGRGRARVSGGAECARAGRSVGRSLADDTCCARWLPGRLLLIPVPVSCAWRLGEGERDGEEGGVVCSQDDDDVGEDEEAVHGSSHTGPVAAVASVLSPPLALPWC